MEASGAGFNYHWSAAAAAAAAARQDNYFPWITSDAVIAVYHVHDGRNTRAVML